MTAHSMIFKRKFYVERSASSVNTHHAKRSTLSIRRRLHQRGVTLIELMVGIAIGLMTIAVALGALLVSRGISGTVSDASQLEQQAAYAFRVMGQQIRQAGSLQLNLAVGTTIAAPPAAAPIIDAEAPVAIMAAVAGAPSAVSGGDNWFTVGHPNYVEPTTTGVAGLFEDCIGGGGGAGAAGVAITNTFALDANQQLTCASPTAGNAGAQPVIRNVTDFQVRYLEQLPPPSPPATMLWINAAGVAGAWPNVRAVEVCLELVGDETIDVPATSTYTNCAGNPAAYGNHLHMVFRNTFEIRSQGA